MPCRHACSIYRVPCRAVQCSAWHENPLLRPIYYYMYAVITHFSMVANSLPFCRYSGVNYTASRPVPYIGILRVVRFWVLSVRCLPTTHLGFVSRARAAPHPPPTLPTNPQGIFSSRRLQAGGAWEALLGARRFGGGCYGMRVDRALRLEPRRGGGRARAAGRRLSQILLPPPPRVGSAPQGNVPDRVLAHGQIAVQWEGETQIVLREEQVLRMDI